MNNFSYFTPTKVIFGKDSELQAGKAIKEYGGSKVLVHFGGNSAQKSGLLDKLCASLKSESIDYVMLGGVVPNPRLSLVRTGIELCKKEQIDFILAVGGGSVIDSAKAIGYGVTNDCDVWDIYLKKVPARACLPIGAVLTIAAAGSEMSDSSVITNEDGWLKRGYSSDYSRCRFALMNPELTASLNEWQTMSGCTDIMMHTMERYFYGSDTETAVDDGANAADNGTCMLTDNIAEGLIKSVMHNALILKKDPHNYNARAQVMWASSLSHNGLTGCGNPAGDWATHQIEHELGGMFDVTHGAGLAAVWASWARYVYKENPARFAQFAFALFKEKLAASGITSSCSDEKAALTGIGAMEDFFHSIGMPVCIKEMNIDLTAQQIDELAFKCSFGKTRTVGTFKKLGYDDLKAIYQAAR